MKKAVVVIVSIIIVSVIYITYVKASSYWTGNNVCDKDVIDNGVTTDKYWNITPDRIYKVNDPGRVYSFNDITSYSAYVSNNTSYIGSYMPKSLYWWNYSRLLYVKLFKVVPGQEVSFIFSNTYYAYCAEYNGDFYLVNDGKWITTGEKVILKQNTQWIMVVFRQDNGNLSNGSGIDTSISSEEIKNQANKYIVFSPFKYTFDPNGGIYSNSNKAFSMNRLGVEQFSLPVPVRSGYRFTGWKSSTGDIYSGTFGPVYNDKLFKDESFTAQWEQIYVSKVDIKEDNITIDMTIRSDHKLNASVLPSDALNKKIIWSVSDKSVASVDQNGNVTSLKVGKCYVTATAADGSGVYDKCSVNVIRSAVTARFVNESIVMEPGESLTPIVNVDHVKGADPGLSYSSDNSRIAKVDNKGMVTAVSQGTANIMVRTSTGHTDTIRIYVTTFNILLPAYIEPGSNFSIKVDISNNGDKNSLNRRIINVVLESVSRLKRIGDINTQYDMNLLSCKDIQRNIRQKETLVETMISTSEEFIITTASPITRAGDYSGNINLSINTYY